MACSVKKRMSILSKVRLLLCAAALFGVTLPVGAQNSAKPTMTDSAPNTDVCKLLSNAEIQAVQGERVEQTKPDARSTGGLLISDCLFRTTTPSKAVSIELVTRDSNAKTALTPQEHWRKQFGAAGAEREANTPEGRENRETPEARRITGIGQEAYWVGTPVAGALYVLQGERFIRISVGGVRDEKTRIERSKSLALAALKRL
jgi:hypothetical protein